MFAIKISRSRPTASDGDLNGVIESSQHNNVRMRTNRILKMINPYIRLNDFGELNAISKQFHVGNFD